VEKMMRVPVSGLVRRSFAHKSLGATPCASFNSTPKRTTQSQVLNGRNCFQEITNKIISQDLTLSQNQTQKVQILMK
jgi:hypothetical protein